MSVDANARLRDACAALSINDASTIAPLIIVLDDLSKALASDLQLRESVGNAEPALWPRLRKLWSTTAAALVVREDDDGTLRKLCLSLARFTRNLVAAVPGNQTRAFENEAELRNLLHHHTSYVMMQDENAVAVTRMLAQTLSNLVTANEHLMDLLWDTYMSLPSEHLILIRLLAAPDVKVVMAALVLVLNCIHSSKNRAKLLTSSSSGSRLCISLLDRVSSLFDAEELSEAGRAFEIGYRVFASLIEGGFIPDLYNRVSVEGEVVTPHQTILLKLLDSYLQHLRTRGPPMANRRVRDLSEMLIAVFFSLSAYAQQAIRLSLGPENTKKPRAPAGASMSTKNPSAPQGPAEPNVLPEVAKPALEELDLLLPKVCEALVLVTQCLISLTLYSESERTDVSHEIRAEEEAELADTLKKFVGSAVSPDGIGAVEYIIETLRLFDLFLPRITFGQVAPPPVLAGEERERMLDAMGAGSDDVDGRGRSTADPKGFSYLKRDLVRLMGILCAEDRSVQDRVRVCGGIPVIMNLCVIDDRNPYMREHAIFTLRNLLHGNAENQAVVNEIQPVEYWDENGVLQDRPAAIRRY